MSFGLLSRNIFDLENAALAAVREEEKTKKYKRKSNTKRKANSDADSDADSGADPGYWRFIRSGMGCGLK